MENPNSVCLTTKDVSEFCQRVKGCEDGILKLAEGIVRIETSLGEQRNDFVKFRSDNGAGMALIQAKWDDRTCARDKENEKRFSSLELWRAWLAGIALVSMGVLGFLLNDMWNLYKNYPQMIKDAVKSELSAKYNIDITR
jgi:hypothetical protein